MSQDFWDINLNEVDSKGRREFGFRLAEAIIRGTEEANLVERRDRFRNFPEHGRWATSPVEHAVHFGESGSHDRMDPIQELAVEVLRHYALGERTPPHLAHSFLDECMATLGEDRSPVTEIWLAERGYVNRYNQTDWFELVLPDSADPRLVFTIERKDRTCSSVDLQGLGDESPLTSIRIMRWPTKAQVLTVGRALGIPTERRT